MKRTIILIPILVAMLLMLPTPVLSGGCGIKPIKPIPPIGCADLEAECVCDATAKVCTWQWRCVKKR